MALRDNKILRALYYRWKNYESRHSYNHGRGNRVSNSGILLNTRVQFRGNNNVVIVEESAVCLNSTIRITGSDCRVILHGRCYVTDVEIFVEDNGCIVSIGPETFIGRNTHIACTENGRKIIIGGNSMISSSCQIRTGDSHSVVDSDGYRINYAASVHIGEHCWIGEGAKILKGVTIGNDCIVSTGAIVTKSFGGNVLVGGVPAKVLRENINWDKKRL